jgi:hypothetical protein
MRSASWSIFQLAPTERGLQYEPVESLVRNHEIAASAEHEYRQTMRRGPSSRLYDLMRSLRR